MLGCRDPPSPLKGLKDPIGQGRAAALCPTEHNPFLLSGLNLSDLPPNPSFPISFVQEKAYDSRRSIKPHSGLISRSAGGFLIVDLQCCLCIPGAKQNICCSHFSFLVHTTPSASSLLTGVFNTVPAPDLLLTVPGSLTCSEGPTHTPDHHTLQQPFARLSANTRKELPRCVHRGRPPTTQ